MEATQQADTDLDSWTLSIRYEGGDAENHTIDLNQLGQSLQGFARVIAVSAHFAQTGKYNKQYDTLSVKVVANPVDDHHCFEVSATVVKLATSPELWSGLGTGLFMGIVGYVFNRRKEEELKHLSAALQQSLGTHADTQAKMLATIEKLADALQPSVRQSLAPIGQSVGSINIRQQGQATASVVLDEETKALASANRANTITETLHFSGVISELDMLNSTCKVSLENDPESRIQSVITDPAAQLPGNRYVTAMAAMLPIKFSGKAEVDQEGGIVKLYISDLA